MMARDELEQKVCEIARALGLRDVQITVEQPGKWYHVLIVSPDFCDRSQGERENIVWSGFEQHLDDETILSITQCYLLTPEERKSTMPMTAT